jgi:hypothetical protein
MLRRVFAILGKSTALFWFILCVFCP